MKEFIRYYDKGIRRGDRLILVVIPEDQLQNEMKKSYYGKVNDAACWIGYGLKNWLTRNWPFNFGKI